MNQQVGQLDPLFAWEQLHQILFDFVRPFFLGEIQPPCQTLHMRVNDNSVSFSKCYTEHHVGCFSRDTRQPEQIFHFHTDVNGAPEE